jgi:hypothetical protein
LNEAHGSPFQRFFATGFFGCGGAKTSKKSFSSS